MFFSWVGRESSPISRHSDRDGIRPGQGEVLVGELTGQGIIAMKAAMPALDPLGSHASRTPVRVRSAASLGTAGSAATRVPPG